MDRRKLHIYAFCIVFASSFMISYKYTTTSKLENTKDTNGYGDTGNYGGPDTEPEDTPYFDVQQLELGNLQPNDDQVTKAEDTWIPEEQEQAPDQGDKGPLDDQGLDTGDTWSRSAKGPEEVTEPRENRRLDIEKTQFFDGQELASQEEEHDDTITVDETKPSDSLEPINNVTTQGNTALSHDISSATKGLNVLLLMADDMRAQLGCYYGPDQPFSKPIMHTPNIDKLASESLLLRNAFIQHSLCNPSRTSMLTSRTPDETQVHSNRVYWRNVSGNFTTLPQYFKEHGYRSIGLGKIFHQGWVTNNQDPASWSEPFWTTDNKDKSFMKKSTDGRSVAVPDNETESLIDTVYTRKAVEILKNLSNIQRESDSAEAFFVGLGFHRPHNALVCPQRFYDLYDLQESHPDVLESEDGSYTIESMMSFRRGYFACISYVDSLIGDVLQSLDMLGLRDSTIVAFVTDHGYHFGEQGRFGKVRNSDVATRVPMILRVPGKTDDGLVSDSLVEALDLFPTLVEAAGLPQVPRCANPGSEEERCVRGASFMPLLSDPTTTHKEAAFSQVTRVVNGKGCMQYSMRTRTYRMSLCLKAKDISENELTKDCDTITMNQELFDHESDHFELINLASDSRYDQTRLELCNELVNHIHLGKK